MRPLAALVASLAVGLLLVAASPVPTTYEPRELVERVEDVLRGKTFHMRASMTVETPRWTRVVEFRSWDDREADRAFIRILGPPKDRGTGFLRVEGSFWTYLPRVERTMRIPPSMMLQSWMGSDFTNDDLARESSLVDDYEVEALGQREIAGVAAVGIELLPRPEAPVVWSRVEAWVELEQLAPLRLFYFDETDDGGFELIRELQFSDVRQVQGRPLPHVWRMIPTDKPGHTTEIRLEEVEFDRELSARLFTQQNLRRATGAR